jgi:hypothetical protein
MFRFIKLTYSRHILLTCLYQARWMNSYLCVCVVVFCFFVFFWGGGGSCLLCACWFAPSFYCYCFPKFSLSDLHILPVSKKINEPWPWVGSETRFYEAITLVFPPFHFVRVLISPWSVFCSIGYSIPHLFGYSGNVLCEN